MKRRRFARAAASLQTCSQEPPKRAQTIARRAPSHSWAQPFTVFAMSVQRKKKVALVLHSPWSAENISVVVEPNLAQVSIVESLV